MLSGQIVFRTHALKTRKALARHLRPQNLRQIKVKHSSVKFKRGQICMLADRNDGNSESKVLIFVGQVQANQRQNCGDCATVHELSGERIRNEIFTFRERF